MRPEAVTLARLRPHLAAWLAKEQQGRPFAVHHVGDWPGPDQLLVGDVYVDVRVCPSELSVREELARERPGDRGLVLLCANQALGADVLARLARRRVRRLHLWDAVMHLFDARSVDPRLVSERWMARALVESAPPSGYERVGARELDLDRAWTALLAHRYEIDAERGLAALLAWAESPASSRLAAAGEQERSAVLDRLGRVVPGARPVLASALAERGDQALALGLVVRVLADGPAGESRVAGRALLGVALGGWAFDEDDGRAWASAAEQRVQELLASDQPAVQAILQRADRLLVELRAEPLAASSNLLTAGLRRRLAQLGAGLADRRTRGRGADRVTAAAAAVRAHRVDDHAETARMAERLVRWLARESPTVGDLPTAARRHAADEAYADWARTALRRATGEPALDEQLRGLVAEADERRRDQDEDFGRLLAEHSARAASGGELLGVEEVLPRVVAPLAGLRPLVVVVLDGMSHRVACELRQDLARRGWVELRQGGGAPTLVLSTLPSLTALSRTSLLSGALASGHATDEAKAFARHPALAAAGARNRPPKLVHKGGLLDLHGGLAAELRAEIAGERRVVGVVVNAIDDHLARSDQLATPWSTAYVPPLRALLDAARDAGRLVVLASDHGHVLDHGAMSRDGGDEHGERWRAPLRPPGEGEMLIGGARVLAGGGRCVLAVDERVRYGQRKHGYHGGASPQEVLAPLLVLSAGLSSGVTGWGEVVHDAPDWWTGAPQTAAAEPRRPPTAAMAHGQLSLEEVDPLLPPGDGHGWIADLLASEVFRAQRALRGRAPLADERIVAILTALAGSGGRMLHSALARQAGIPALRLTGSLAALRAILNVEGYPVLGVDDATDDVVLDLALLRAQFDLPDR